MPKTVSVGTLESSDCMMTIKPHHTTVITIHTVVHEAFYDHIKQTIDKMIAAHNLKNVHVICEDKGALDYTIRARLKTAIERYKDIIHG